jgi:hypothetical protein
MPTSDTQSAYNCHVSWQVIHNYCHVSWYTVTAMLADSWYTRTVMSADSWYTYNCHVSWQLMHNNCHVSWQLIHSKCNVSWQLIHNARCQVRFEVLTAVTKTWRRVFCSLPIFRVDILPPSLGQNGRHIQLIRCYRYQTARYQIGVHSNIPCFPSHYMYGSRTWQRAD